MKSPSASAVLDALDTAFQEYEDRVYAVARFQFTQHILPWLKENRYSLATGMGDWAVSYHSKPKLGQCKGVSICLDKGKLPESILDILRTDVPGMPANDLGSLMPEYTNPDDLHKEEDNVD